MTCQQSLADRFEAHRPRLRGLAQRMLGSASDADDVVQDVWLRVSSVGDDDIENFGGWLTTITSRVCLNVLRSRAARGESSYDALAAPVIELDSPAVDPAAEAQLADAVGTALMLVLDRLSPAERVAFVLHDSFDVPFDQIADLLDRSPDAARQLASRARRRIRAAATEDDPGSGRRRPIVDAFFAAARDGDFDRLVSLLSPEVELRVDSGLDATSIIRGAAAVAGQALMFATPAAALHPVLVDGLPGVVITVDEQPVSVMAFDVEAGLIVGIEAFAGRARVARLALPL